MGVQSDTKQSWNDSFQSFMDNSKNQNERNLAAKSKTYKQRMEEEAEKKENDDKAAEE